MFSNWPWKKWRLHRPIPFRKELDEHFNDLIRMDVTHSRECLKDVGFPHVDISESRRKITIIAEMPCIAGKHKEICVTLKGRTLNIRGGKKQRNEINGENHQTVKGSYVYFDRKIKLPAEVDLNQLKAFHGKGLLTIKLKKTHVSDGKKIEIKA